MDIEGSVIAVLGTIIVGVMGYLGTRRGRTGAREVDLIDRLEKRLGDVETRLDEAEEREKALASENRWFMRRVFQLEAHITRLVRHINDELGPPAPETPKEEPR